MRHEALVALGLDSDDEFFTTEFPETVGATDNHGSACSRPGCHMAILPDCTWVEPPLG